MQIRQALVGAALAGSLTFGGATAALATPSAPTPAPTAACKAAAKALAEARALDARLRHEYARVVALRNRAEQRGNTKAVKALDARLAAMRKLHATIVAHVKADVAKVKAECKPAA